MDGNWHHVAFGYDANTFKVWYDGALKSSKTGTHALSTSWNETKGLTSCLKANVNM